MNVSPKREGFIEIEGEANKPEPKPRSAPPPEIEPSPAELPSFDIDQWPIVIKLLYKPIRNNAGEEIKEVKLREPRAGDINRNGNPIRVNNDGDLIIDERKMTYMDQATFQALIRLHGALTNHLVATALPLPQMVQYQFFSILPSLVVSHKLYADAARADEVVAENRIVHPAFCPLLGQALSK